MTKGRSKARIENIITLAHQIETMSRQGKKLKSLDHYLKTTTKTQGTDEGVFAALKMAEAKGLVTITERAK